MNRDNRSTDTPSGASPADHSSTQQYEIRVKGHLGSRWAAWFDGLNVTNEDDGRPDMTTATRTPMPTRQPMTPMRKTALAAGVLYLLTFVTSIPALGLYDDVLNNPDFVVGAGNESGALWGAFLELFAGLTCIGTAVVLYRVIRRDRESAAMGFVAARTLEAGMIFVGALTPPDHASRPLVSERRHRRPGRRRRGTTTQSKGTAHP